MYPVGSVLPGDETSQSTGGLHGRAGATPRLSAVAAEITLDEGLLGLLRGAFDTEGELSAKWVTERCCLLLCSAGKILSALTLAWYPKPTVEDVASSGTPGAYVQHDLLVDRLSSIFY